MRWAWALCIHVAGGGGPGLQPARGQALEDLFGSHRSFRLEEAQMAPCVQPAVGNP